MDIEHVADILIDRRCPRAAQLWQQWSAAAQTPLEPDAALAGFECYLRQIPLTPLLLDATMQAVSDAFTSGS